MKKTADAENRRSLLIVLTILGLIASFVFLPPLFRSAAGNESERAGFNQVSNHIEGLENYDIRTDKAAAETLLNFRRTAGRNAVEIADVRDKFVKAENLFRQTIPSLKIEYNNELLNPEVIAADVLKGGGFLTAPTTAKRATVLSNFAKANGDLLAVTTEQIENLKIAADYTNPNGELSFARLEQFVNGIPVFRSEIRAGFNKQGAMFRVVNNLAPALDYASLTTEFGSPADAVSRAAGYINHGIKDSERTRNDAASTDLKVVFGQGDWATTAEKIYFPTEVGVAVPAWRILFWELGAAYYVIVEAQKGTLLYRENITYHQTQPATYNVYANTTSLLKTMANPAPIAGPGLIDPSLQTQGIIQPRSNVTLIGSEAPYTFNNNGWITDNANGVNGHTDGNNVEAGVDRSAPDGVDARVAGTNRIFDFDYTPGAGLGTSGDSPLLPAYQNGAVTNLFYVTNRYHDETYLLGFTEQARNFQNNNFGRGGAQGDRISAEAQDNTVGFSCPAQPCVNNANFSTPADGGRGKMQMYIWNLMEPDRDGDLDAEIIVHELTHGLFGRLHNGLGGTQAAQMNEGNSDFFAHVLLSETTDPINGVYVTGGYSTLNLRNTIFGGKANYYYGIRRFPKAVIAFTGGPNNRPHNPLTYADIDPAQMNLTNGAFAPAFTGTATQAHAGGEIWSSMLWEVRARLVQRLGAEVGNKKVLQLVMDGMKIAPSSPTMLSERNAILQAAQATGDAADVSDIWAGFAARGLGFNATNPTGNTVTENFDLPNASLAAAGFSVADPSPGGDEDGFAEPGETVQLTIPVSNNTDNVVNNVAARITGGENVNYGTIANGQIVSRQILYKIPANADCGSLHSVAIIVSSEIGSQPSQNRSFRLGAPVFSGSTQIFDGVTAPALPANWSQENSGANTGWVTSTILAESAPNAAFAPAPPTSGQENLTTTAKITSTSAQLSFKNFYNTEVTWDGMILEIRIGNGDYREIITAGGSFVSGGYNTTMNSLSPFGARQAWSGNSTAFINTVINLPAAANGQIINLRWQAASDANTTASGTPGHRIDDVILTDGTFLSGYECVTVSTTTTSHTRADFDGDGKTDFSVFRFSNGNWYLNQSTDGFTAKQWGANGDKLVPGDFDGDGKTDLAVARPNTDNTALVFYILNSATSTVTGFQWGASDDVPAIGDYDGDGKSDIAVFRPSNGVWYVFASDGNTISTAFGQNGDIPAANDYDGDGVTDLAVIRSGIWYIKYSGGGFAGIAFGAAGDKFVPADYDGDGAADIAVYRPSNGVWYIQQSTAGFTGVSFGAPNDVPVPGDYDGDGKSDVAVYRGGTWYVNQTTAGLLTTTFGASDDAPIPKQYIP